MKALIIVDIQNDFLPGGKLAVPKGNEVISFINSIQQDYDLVVATQDWHPTDHQSFASQHKGKTPFEQIDLHGLPQTLWPDHCVQNTPGAEFAPALDQARIQAIFRKGTNPAVDSYSGFFDNGRLQSTGLGGYLNDKHVRSVHVVGLAADYCVYYTAVDSLELGFETSILTKGTKPIDRDRFIDQRSAYLAKGGNIL